MKTVQQVLLIDLARVDNALVDIYSLEPLPVWGYLFEGTVFENVKKHGVMWLNVTDDTQLQSLATKNARWRSSCILVTSKQATNKELIDYLKSLFPVKLELSSEQAFLRFHSPRILDQLNTLLSQPIKTKFLGPINMIDYSIYNSNTLAWQQKQCRNPSPSQDVKTAFTLPTSTLEGLS